MTQAGVWWAAGLCAFVAVVAGAAERVRGRRCDLDRVGLIPWGGISLTAFIGAIVGFAMGLKI